MMFYHLRFLNYIKVTNLSKIETAELHSLDQFKNKSGIIFFNLKED